MRVDVAGYPSMVNVKHKRKAPEAEDGGHRAHPIAAQTLATYPSAASVNH